MIGAWRRLSQEQRRTWGFVAGAICVGTVVKVAYFNVSRNMIVKDTDRITKEGMEHLREARAYAEWSRKDREARLPKLTDEQRQQMREYLSLVEMHGLKKSFTADGDDCVGCPVMQHGKRALKAISGSSASKD